MARIDTVPEIGSGATFWHALQDRWQKQARAALPWTFAMYVVLMTWGWGLSRWMVLMRQNPLGMALGVLGGCALLVGLWAQANRRWCPTVQDPSPSGHWVSLWGWMLWSLTWIVGVWGLIGLGYNMHPIWGNTVSLIVMILGAFALFGSLGVFGTVAGAYGESPTYRWMVRRVRKTPRAWVLVLLGVISGDVLVVSLVWLASQVGWVGQALAGMFVVGWSILEPLSILLLIPPEQRDGPPQKTALQQQRTAVRR